MSPAIEVSHLTKRFVIHHDHSDSLKEMLLGRITRRQERSEEFLALDDVSLSVPAGSVFGLIGPNGAGKSTLLKCLAKIYEPDAGSIVVRGRMSSLLELGTGFHPDLTGRENVFLNASILGLSRKAIARRFDDIVAFAELERFIDNPIKTYSSGMVVRLGFSVATCVEPEILLVDEVLAVGDTRFKRKSRERMENLLTSGCTIVLVAHDLGTIRSLCSEAASLVDSKVRCLGTAADVVDDYTKLMAEADRAASGGGGQGGSDGERFAAAGTIVRSSLCDTSGAEVDAVEPSAPFVVRVVVDAARCPADAILTLSLRSGDGTLLSFLTSNEVLTSLPSHGEVVAEAALEGLRLASGQYEVTVGVRDARTSQIVDRADRAMRFAVTGKAAAGYVSPVTTWSRRELGSDVAAELRTR
jgi:ABC-2 type transport system ATP-binding protein